MRPNSTLSLPPKHGEGEEGQGLEGLGGMS